MDAVGAQAHRLHHVADGAGLHQSARLHRGAVLEPLGIADGIDAPGLGLHPLHLGQLLERGDAWLVRHIVLAVAHDAHAERRALIRNDGGDDELNAAILQDAPLIAHAPRIGITLCERRGEIVFLRVERHKLAPAADDRVALPIDVRMVHADDAEAQARAPRFRPRDARKRAYGGRRARRVHHAAAILVAHRSLPPAFIPP
jgi:hypothetical protein